MLEQKHAQYVLKNFLTMLGFLVSDLQNQVIFSQVMCVPLVLVEIQKETIKGV